MIVISKWLSRPCYFCALPEHHKPVAHDDEMPVQETLDDTPAETTINQATEEMFLPKQRPPAPT